MEELIDGLRRVANSVIDYRQSSWFSLYLLLPLLCFPSPRGRSLLVHTTKLLAFVLTQFLLEIQKFFLKNYCQFPSFDGNFYRILSESKISLAFSSKILMENSPDGNSVGNLKIRRRLAASPTVHFSDTFSVGDGYHFSSD